MKSLDLAEAARALAAAFPDLDRNAPLRLLNESFNSYVVETVSSVIFRIARHDAAGQGYLLEKQALADLAPQLPVRVPDYRWFAHPDSHFRYGALDYQGIPGRLLHVRPESPGTSRALEDISADVARFMAALHRIPPSSAPSVKTQLPEERRREWEATREVCLPALLSVLRREEYNAIVDLWDAFLHDPCLDEYPPTIRHGDLWYGNLLIDENGALGGVVDFERLAVSDPADDLAVQYHLGEEFAAKVLHAYRQAGGPCDDALPLRARRLWQVRHFEGLRWSILLKDDTEFEEAVEKIRAGCPSISPQSVRPAV